MLSKDDIIEHIQELRDLPPYGEDNGTTASRIMRMQLALEYAEMEDPNIQVFWDCVEIDNKYIATYANLRWRVKGKAVWYHYSNPTDLLHKLRRTSC
jgi:hypothetical protein